MLPLFPKWTWSEIFFKLCSCSSSPQLNALRFQFNPAPPPSSHKLIQSISFFTKTPTAGWHWSSRSSAPAALLHFHKADVLFKYVMCNVRQISASFPKEATAESGSSAPDSGRARDGTEARFSCQGRQRLADSAERPSGTAPPATEWGTWQLQLKEHVRGHRVVFAALVLCAFLLLTWLAPWLKLTEALAVSVSLSHLALTSLHVTIKVGRSPLFSVSSLHLWPLGFKMCRTVLVSLRRLNPNLPFSSLPYSFLFFLV